MKTYVGNQPPSSAVILGQMPIGGIIQWGSESIPAGWLELNGQSTTQFPELATIFGANLPDMRGQFARGRDNGAGVDPDEPRAVLSVQADDVGNHGHTASFVGDALANHNHTFTGNALPPHTHTYPVGTNSPDYQRAAAGNSSPTANPQTYGKSAGTPTGSISNKSAGTPSGTVTVGDATGVETRPTNVALIFIVKAYMAGTTPVLGMLPANKNYIINPTFSINQRAFAGGALSNYGWDRWQAVGASVSVALSVDTVTITSGAIRQILENFGYAGVATLSWDGDSVVNINRIGIGAVHSGVTSPFTFDMFDTPDGNEWNFTFSGDGTSFSKIKLEVGSVATPFEYPDEGTELAKCQRFYCRVMGQRNMLPSSRLSNSQFWTNVATPVPMRASPSFVDANVFVIHGGGATVSDLTVQSVQWFENDINLAITLLSPSLVPVAGQAYATRHSSSGTYMTLDAEL